MLTGERLGIQGILDNISRSFIFDFDDTLAIHEDKDYGKHRRENEDKYLSSLNIYNDLLDNISKYNKLKLSL